MATLRANEGFTLHTNHDLFVSEEEWEIQTPEGAVRYNRGQWGGMYSNILLPARLIISAPTVNWRLYTCDERGISCNRVFCVYSKRCMGAS